jgi:hypothetical protein
LRSDITIPAGLTVVHGLVFVTATPPETIMGKPGDTKRPQKHLAPKVLAAYKLWVGDQIIGVGPGRGRCSPGAECVGPYGSTEQPYDGYDVTSQVNNVAGPLAVFATGYGEDQSAAQGGYGSNAPKFQLQLHLLFRWGIVVGLAYLPYTSTHLPYTSTHLPYTSTHLPYTSTHHAPYTSTHHAPYTSTHYAPYTSTHHAPYTSTHHAPYTRTVLATARTRFTPPTRLGRRSMPTQFTTLLQTLGAHGTTTPKVCVVHRPPISHPLILPSSHPPILSPAHFLSC